MRACENKNRILNDPHRLTNNEMHCYSSSNTLYIMAVLHQCYDKYFTLISTCDSNKSSSLSSFNCCQVGFTSLCSLEVLLSHQFFDLCRSIMIKICIPDSARNFA
ncbi:hypothetical protein T07_12349 [Trichinella nelsoni]|uniref:Uncharacterized protein n=1 Tax=Trichinella nelsoni TaxID=6336 RepID=A0A0V0RE02_9BILA|nr:hypothetical protein T07_12349 [Trichinella nelsoni]